MIDIEKEILAMSEEAKDLPETMNMDRIRRRAKKRKRIHTIGVIGKSLAGVLVTMFLALFIAVPALNAGNVGIMVPVGVLFTLGVSRLMYKKGML